MSPDASSDADANPDATGPVTVTVTGGVGEPGQGLPIVDAYVVLVSADGETQVVTTSGDGTATGEITGTGTIHVAYRVNPGGAVAGGDMWRVASFYEIEIGTQLLVGAPGLLTTSNSMTIALPATVTTDYGVTGPTRCRLEGFSTTTDVVISYASSCEGQTVPVFGHSEAGWLDLGTITLANTTSLAPGGSWITYTPHPVRFTGLPIVADYVAGVQLIKLFGADAVPIADDGNVTSTGELELTGNGANYVPDRIVAYASGDSKKGSGRLFTAAPPPVVLGERMITAADLPRAIDDVAFDRASRTATWRYGTTGTDDVLVMTLVSFETATADLVDWSSYRRSSATIHSMPTLPAPLDVLIPSSVSDLTVGVAVTSMFGLAYPDLLARIDRELSFNGPEEVDPTRDTSLSWRMTSLTLGGARTTPPSSPWHAPWQARHRGR